MSLNTVVEEVKGYIEWRWAPGENLLLSKFLGRKRKQRNFGRVLMCYFIEYVRPFELY